MIRSVGLWLISLWCATAGLAAPDELTTVAEVRQLTQEQARTHLPVRLRGVITFINADAGHAFVQDATGSIFFSPGFAGTPGAVSPALGETVEIFGQTVAGEFSPSVAGGTAADGTRLPVQLQHLPEIRTPAPEPVDLREIRQTRWHDQLVQVRGTVREVTGEAGKPYTFVRLILSDRSGNTIEAFIYQSPRVPTEWLQQEVSLIAVVAGGTNERGTFGNVRLLIPKFSDLTLLPRLADEPRSIASLFLYQPPLSSYADAAPRWSLQGVVSLVRPGEGFFLLEDQNGVWVQTPQKISLSVGTSVRTEGYAMQGPRGTFLADGIVAPLSVGPAPTPLWHTLAEAERPSAEASLAELTGTISALAMTPQEQIVYLRDDSGQAFEARSRERWQTTPLSVGALVRVTGVCQTSPPHKQPSLLTLLLRSETDVQVLRPAPWLTTERLRWLLLGLGVLVGLGLLWLLLLKRQVSRQTRQLMEGVIERTLLEERQRLGRDLHDSLEQQLAGLHLHLQALQDWTAASPSPPHIQQSVVTAGRMLDHCRAEARRSVYDLRSGTLEREGLVGALRELVAGTPSATFTAPGSFPALPKITEFHLLRCAQEALGNALKHAEAKNILISLTCSTNVITLTIKDDGKGFDPAVVARNDGQHFGLRHLQERVNRLQGKLQITTQVNVGTSLTFTIPTVP